MNIFKTIKLGRLTLTLLKLLNKEKIMKNPQTTWTGIATAVVSIVAIFWPDIPGETRAQLIAGIAAIGVTVGTILAADAKNGK